MRVVRFRYYGKFGHFLKAEANVDGLTYPVPTPTVLLGLAGAVLGLGKDEPQIALVGSRSGGSNRRDSGTRPTSARTPRRCSRSA